MPKTITKIVYTFAELLAGADDPASPITSRAVEKARAWLQEGQTGHEWFDGVLEDWKNALDQIGFENANIHFSGFWSQGDGASFTADVDLDKLVAFLSTPIAPENCIGVVAEGEENYRPWIVHKIGGKATDPRYRRLLLDAVSNVVDDCRVRRGSSRYEHESTCSFEFDLALSGESAPKTGNWSCDYPRLEKLASDFRTDAEELRRDLCRAIYKSLEEEYEYLTGDEAIADFAEANECTFDVTGERDG